MKSSQLHQVSQVREKLMGCRVLLDSLMYGNDPVNDNEFNKLRAAYDLICQANDAL